MSILKDTLTGSQQEKILIEKMRTLPPERLAEVEDFIDFLNLKDQVRNDEDLTNLSLI